MVCQNKQFQLFVVLIIGTLTALIQGFASVSNVSSGRSQTLQPSSLTDREGRPNYGGFWRIPVESTSIIMSSTGPNAGLDGTGPRGQIILAIALLITIWLFSIPPEFRRAHVCTVERCVANRASCNDCQTFDEIRDGIVQYYKSGGGIQFDFSIDPTTIEKNKEFMKTVGL
jgi:hypothetical protein